MGGSPDSGSPIKFDWENRKTDYRKTVLARVMTGVPAFALCVFSLFFTYRYLDRPFGDMVFWVVLGVILFVFAIYFGNVAYLIKKGKSAEEAGGGGE